MFIALHMSDHNFIGGVRTYTSEDDFEEIKESIWAAFTKSDLPGMILSIDRHFDVHAYSLWHLFPDGKRKVMYSILNEALESVEYAYNQLCHRHFPFVTAMKELNIPSPVALDFPIQYTLNRELIASLEEESIDVNKIQRILDDMNRGNFLPDTKLLSVHAAQAIARMLTAIAKDPDHIENIKAVNRLFSLLSPLGLSMDLWTCQNTYYRIGEQMCHEIKHKMGTDDDQAEWIREYSFLGEYLGVRCHSEMGAE